MSSFDAIGPGTDLAQRARELRRVHEAVLTGASPARDPRPVVARSWRRVMQAGVVPDRVNGRDPAPTREVERRRAESPLSAVIDDLTTSVAAVADASLFLMVVTDAEGVVLWRRGSSAVRRQADALGFTEGALWTETQVGTNAIGTALAERSPVQLFSAEHFEQHQHPWYCTAAPLHDPRTGDLVGIVDVSGPALTLHPAIGALVRTAVRLTESQLWRRHEDGLDRLRRQGEALLSQVHGPALLVDDHGWVAGHRGVAVRDRVAAPRDGVPQSIPGLGLCLPEQLADGWLLRPLSADASIRVRLVVGAQPVALVSGAGEEWRGAMSPRHAQILTSLHRAGRAGLTAGQLSVELFGDADHEVAVRAEISRLRRVLGGVVSTRPYRIAPGVRFEISP